MGKVLGRVAVALLSPLFFFLDTEAAPLDAIVFPVNSFQISSGFGGRIHPLRKVKHVHSGIDFVATFGEKVRAVSKGKVVFASFFGGYGRLVTIEHDAGISSLYGHLSKVSVMVGEDVVAGEIIGEVGESGQTTGAHLHFEVRIHGVAVDPAGVWGD